MLHNSESECSSSFLSETGDDIVFSNHAGLLIGIVHVANVLASGRCRQPSCLSTSSDRCSEMGDKFEDQNLSDMELTSDGGRCGNNTARVRGVSRIFQHLPVLRAKRSDATRRANVWAPSIFERNLETCNTAPGQREGDMSSQCRRRLIPKPICTSPLRDMTGSFI
jgi:hypothetical protein